jgi:hypothetical protein
MRYGTATLLASAIVLALAVMPASAQGKKASKREAAISACVEEVNRSTPDTTGERMRERAALWIACMQRHGQRP